MLVVSGVSRQPNADTPLTGVAGPVHHGRGRSDVSGLYKLIQKLLDFGQIISWYDVCVQLRQNAHRSPSLERHEIFTRHDPLNIEHSPKSTGVSRTKRHDRWHCTDRQSRLRRPGEEGMQGLWN